MKKNAQRVKKVETIQLMGGGSLIVHNKKECAGPTCVIHSPSEHPLADAPLIWRGDRWPPFMERACEHGIGHPDPDSLAYLRAILDPDMWDNYALEVHGCDGCCVGEEKELHYAHP